MELTLFCKNYIIEVFQGNSRIEWVLEKWTQLNSFWEAVSIVEGLSSSSSSSSSDVSTWLVLVFQSLGFALGPVKGDNGKVSIMFVSGSTCDSGLSYSSKLDFYCDPKSGQVRQLRVFIRHSLQFRCFGRNCEILWLGDSQSNRLCAVF